MNQLKDFDAIDIHGQRLSLSAYADQVVLIVNVASKCGFTKQYAGLERLQTELGPQGFTVLGFPCNQFGAQEPGSAQEILTFCETTFGVSFPLFAKIDVNGEQAPPLFHWLKKSAPGLLGSQSIKWNFTKFLVGRDGHVIKRYAPNTSPEDLRIDIMQALAQPVSSKSA